MVRAGRETDASRMGSLREDEAEGGFGVEEGGVSGVIGVGAVCESRLAGMGMVGNEGRAVVVELEGMGFV